MLHSGAPKASWMKARVGWSIGSPVNESFCSPRCGIRDAAGIAHHPVMRRGGRQIGGTEVLQRLQQALRAELSGIRAGLDPERQRRQRAVPQAVAPGGRGRAEKPVAGPQPGAVQRRVHHDHHSAVGMPDCRRASRAWCPRCTERSPGRRRRSRARYRSGKSASAAMNSASAATTRGPSMASQRRRFVRRGEQQRRCTVLGAKPDAVGPEQGEQRHRDGATLHSAEQRGIERQRWLQHDGDPVAGLHPLRREPVREPRRPGGQFGEADRLIPAIGMRHTQCDPSRASRDDRRIRARYSAARRLPSNRSHRRCVENWRCASA